jgi:hypothetical protein
MDSAGTNYLAVIAAAVAAWLWGAAWYGVLGNAWMKAARIDPNTMRMRAMPFVVSFVCEIVMAFVMAGAIGHLGAGQVTLLNGVISALILWAGFIATTIAVNQRYQGFGWSLTVIDAGHWLGVALIMGAIIGWFGAPAAAA